MSAFRVYKHYFLATGDAVDADATGYAGISPSVNADAPKKCGNAGLYCRIIIKPRILTSNIPVHFALLQLACDRL